MDRLETAPPAIPDAIGNAEAGLPFPVAIASSRAVRTIAYAVTVGRVGGRSASRPSTIRACGFPAHGFPMFFIMSDEFKRRGHSSPLRAIAARLLIRCAGQSQRDVADLLNIGSGSGLSLPDGLRNRGDLDRSGGFVFPSSRSSHPTVSRRGLSACRLPCRKPVRAAWSAVSVLWYAVSSYLLPLASHRRHS